MPRATIHRVLVKTGDELRPGTPMFELRVDLGADKLQDCPPLVFLRVIATERAYLRQLDVTVGSVQNVGAALGIAASTPDETLDGHPVRALRTTAVAIQVDPLSR